MTLVFGNELISILAAPAGDSAGTANGVNTNTIEIVLSSLVGVGIGGLIAIAGQLVQDSGQGPNRNEQLGNADRSQRDDLDGLQGTG